MELPIIKDAAVPPNTIYIGSPKDFGVLLSVPLAVVLNPSTVMDGALRQRIEQATKRTMQLRGVSPSD